VFKYDANLTPCFFAAACFLHSSSQANEDMLNINKATMLIIIFMIFAIYSELW